MPNTTTDHTCRKRRAVRADFRGLLPPGSWYTVPDLNREHLAYKASALTIELTVHDRAVMSTYAAFAVSADRARGGLRYTANVSAALCWMPPEDGAVGEG